jgi:hypothetical protein
MKEERGWLKKVLDDVKNECHPDTKNIHICSCCGQKAPYPTEPGEWEYCENPNMKNQKWIRVSVELPDEDDKYGPDGLRLRKDGELIWWPNNSAWRKFKV